MLVWHTLTCSLTLAAAYIEAIESFLGLPHAITVPHVASRDRREYRGNRQHVELSPVHAYAWMQSFENIRGEISAVCDDVFRRYEADVNVYGYSLVEPMRALPSPALDPFTLVV